MKIIMAGAGAIGWQVVKTLAADGQDVVVVEPDAAVIRDISNRLDCMVIQGEASSIEDLEEAGIAEADFFLALTGSDEINIIACALVSVEYPKVRTIARIRSGKYGNARLYRSFESGISHIINPETETAINILTTLAYGALSDINAFPGLDIQIRSTPVSSSMKLAGKYLKDISGTIGKRFLVPLIHRNESYLIPQGNTMLALGDILYMTAQAEDFEDIFEAMGKNRANLRSVLIVGGGRMSEVIAAYLTGVHESAAGDISTRADLPEGVRKFFGRRRVRIVENEYQRCKELSEALPNATIIHGDIADEQLFDEEQLADCDVVIALSDSEEHNIIAGLYAKRRGIKRSICLVHSGNYLAIARHLDVDVAVSLKNAVATTVLGIIRKGQVASVRSIGDGSVEVIEFLVEQQHRVCGKAVMHVTFPPETLLLALKRGSRSLIPGGSTVFEADDRIWVLCRKEQARKVQALFCKVEA